MFLNHGIAGCVGIDPPVVVSEVGAAIVRHWTVRQVAVAVVGWGTCDH